MTHQRHPDDHGRHARGGFAPGAGPASGRWARGVWSVVLAALFLGLGAGAARAQESELEYKVKAAFLYNFIGFVEWPTNKLARTDKEVIIGCLPDDAAMPIIAHALEGKIAEGRRIKVVILREGEEAAGCHLLFLSRARRNQISEVLARLKTAPVLTVGEVEQFGERGGMINLVRHERTFRFEVNLGAAERVGLRISSKLSSMATLVKTTTPP